MNRELRAVGTGTGVGEERNRVARGRVSAAPAQFIDVSGGRGGGG